MSNAIDGDGDGFGEYGFFGELAGVDPLRTFQNGMQVIGSAVLSPPLLPPRPFGNVMASVVTLNGYYVQMWLPGPYGIGGPEDALGGAAIALHYLEPDACEVVWCAYAWPMRAGVTGQRVFFVNQSGEVLAAANNFFPPYSGSPVSGFPPQADAAFAVGGNPTEIDGVTAPYGPNGFGIDGQVWSVVLP